MAKSTRDWHVRADARLVGGAPKRLSALQRRVAEAVKASWRKSYPKERILRVRHIYPRAYVVAKPAPGCLVVAIPAVDAEPHMREWVQTYGADVLHPREHDEVLAVGQWCSVAYVSTPTSGSLVAIKVVP